MPRSESMRFQSFKVARVSKSSRAGAPAPQNPKQEIQSIAAPIATCSKLETRNLKLLIPQRLDRVQARRLDGGNHPAHDAHKSQYQRRRQQRAGVDGQVNVA